MDGMKLNIHVKDGEEFLRLILQAQRLMKDVEETLLVIEKLNSVSTKSVSTGADFLDTSEGSFADDAFKSFISRLQLTLEKLSQGSLIHPQHQ